jgi:hypothetical protein
MKALVCCVLTALTICAVVAGTAQATEPQFHYEGAALTETLPFDTVGGVGHLYVPVLGISMQCDKHQDVGFGEPNGKTKVSVVFEECEVIGLTGCTVNNIEN